MDILCYEFQQCFKAEIHIFLQANIPKRKIVCLHKY